METINFPAAIMQLLEHAGVRGLSVDLAIHKARVYDIEWEPDLVLGHFDRLERAGQLLYRKGYYRLKKYERFQHFI